MYEGTRLLTVGRLTYQKAYDIAIDALRILKDLGYQVRWYVLGEGEQRPMLEKKIAALGLKEDFVLLEACISAVIEPFFAFGNGQVIIIVAGCFHIKEVSSFTRFHCF